MMRGLGLGFFGAVATSLHLGAFYLSASDGAAQAGGDQGADQMTLAASVPQMQAMVQRWKAPPDVAQRVTTRVALPVTSVPNVTAPKAIPAPVALPALPQIARIDPVEDRPNDTTPAAAPSAPPQPEAPKPVAQAPDPKPLPKPAAVKPAAEPAPKKQASGSETATQNGTGGTGASQSLSKAQIASLQSRWGVQVQSKIHRNMRYPRGSKDTGTAKVALTVAPDGRLMGVKLLRSSGSSALDQAALKAVQRAGRFAKAPKGLTKASYGFTVPLTFSK